MPLYQIKAAEKLMLCRTEALGGHAVYCEDGHLNGVWYNSCKHRSCPQCSAMKSEQWLLKAETLLLQCQHHHWVFTLTHDLHGIWRFNRAFCQQLLFESVRKTLQILSKDKKYLGAQIACMMALHTWARNQVFHPHMHCLVSHGGLDDDGKWQSPKRKSFLPAKVMMRIFKGKYLDGIKKALAKGELVIPTDMSEQKVINLCNKLGRQCWVVHCVKPYQQGNSVANYLARYIRGGSIKNSQIVQITDNTVRFRYKSHQTQQTEYLTLSHEAFMQRLLSHLALPKKPQYQMIGLYHPHCREKLNQARTALGQGAVKIIKKMDWLEYVASKGKQSFCKLCGKPLTILVDLKEEGGTQQLDFLSI